MATKSRAAKEDSRNYWDEKFETMPTTDLLKFQLEKSLELLKEDTIQGVVILGDREIKKCPEQAELIKGFLKGI
jgi:hypothetical protein